MPIGRRYLETNKIKSWRNHATHEGPSPQRFCGLPTILGHNKMGMLPVLKIPSEVGGFSIMAVIRSCQNQGIAGGKMPDFNRIDPMPSRTFAGLQQEVNAGQRSSRAIIRYIAKGLDIVTTFGVWFHTEVIDDPNWRHHRLKKLHMAPMLPLTYPLYPET